MFQLVAWKNKGALLGLKKENPIAALEYPSKF